MPLHFLAGLPRTGSTLLGALLNQNPCIRVSATSPLCDLLVATNETINTLDSLYAFDSQRISAAVYRDIVGAFYHREEAIHSFDKHRLWPRHVDAIRQFISSEPRIVCTIRPISEIITSYLVLADRDANNFIDRDLVASGKPISNEARARLLWDKYLKAPYESMQVGLRNYSQNILLIEYDALVYRTANTLSDVYDFCEMDHFTHDLDNVTNSCREKDWGMADLHTIRRCVEKRSLDPLAFLPPSTIAYFDKFNLGVHRNA